MNPVTTRILLSCAATMLLTGCPGGGPSSPLTYLQFDYVVLPSQPDAVDTLSDAIRDGDISFDSAMFQESSDTPCTYVATFQSIGDYDGSTIPQDQRTKAPDLDAFGSHAGGNFTFILDAHQSRTLQPECGSLADTVQGMTLISGIGPIDGQWRNGNEAEVVMRPSMTPTELGPAVNLRNDYGEGQQLFFEYAVDSESSNGYVEGRFRFLVTTEAGDRLVIANNGQFGMLR